MSCEKLEAVVTRLEKIADQLSSAGMKGSSAGGGDDSRIVEELDPIISGPVAQFVKLSEKIDKEVGEAAKSLQKCFDITKELMGTVSKSKKPSDSQLANLLKPLSSAIEETKGFPKKFFKSNFKSHLEAMAEFASSFAWVQSPGKPHLFITESIDSGMFYANRVLTSFKDKGPDHKDWVVGLKKCFEDLRDYAKDFHPTGCAWNPKGSDAGSSAAAAPQVVKPQIGGGGGAGPAALFSQLNKGTAITGGLKKVDDSQKTHKNPNLRAGATVSDSPKPATKSAKKGSAPASNKPPVFKCENRKWTVENQVSQPKLEITDGDKTYSVYIYNCVDTNVFVNNKLNVITLDGCTNCKVQVKAGLIASFEITNCNRVELHADDNLPFVIINSSDRVQVYLNDKSVGAKVSTNNSTTVNVCHWQSDGELVEYPVPELFVSTIKGKKLVTEISENV